MEPIEVELIIKYSRDANQLLVVPGSKSINIAIRMGRANSSNGLLQSSGWDPHRYEIDKENLQQEPNNQIHELTGVLCAFRNLGRLAADTVTRHKPQDTSRRLASQVPGATFPCNAYRGARIDYRLGD